MAKASGYLVIEPVWRGRHLAGAKIRSVTQTKPKGGKVGSAVVHLTVEVPDIVFKPFEVEAAIRAQAGDTGVIEVVVKPYAEAESDS